jgi:hypothetical protein
MRHRGDEQAAGHKEAQTHHEAESESRRSDETQVQLSDLYRTDRWQGTDEGQECQAGTKQQKTDQRKPQL